MPLLVAKDGGGVHGEARYFLTGTDDFSYILDEMVEDELIVASSATQNDKADMLTLYDGYRLKFSMLDMVQAVNDNENDTCAICLASQAGKGATCAGLYYDGSSVKTWARWIDWEIFYVAAVDGTFTDPEGQDDSAKWYLLDLTMDPDITVTG